MKKVRAITPFADIWRPILIALVGIIFVGGLLSYRLGSLTPGLSQAEVSIVNQSSSAEQIISNPLHLPQKAGQLILSKVGYDSIAAKRAPNIIIGLMTIFAMFVLLKNWYSTRVASLGTILFASSSWFLHTTRVASGDINFMFPLILLAAGSYLYKGRYILLASLAALMSIGLMLYIPGMIWPVLGILIWRRKLVKKINSRISLVWRIVGLILLAIGIAPLVWAFVHDSSLLRTWLGLPEFLPDGVKQYLLNVINTVASIFILRQENAALGVGRLPLLDIFTTGMAILGSYAMLVQLGLDRARLLVSIMVFGVLVVALSGPVSISFLLPFVYLLAAGGIALMLQKWFTVFPKNPAARLLAIIFISLAVSISAYYNLTRYFIAWPNTTETKQTFDKNI